MKSTRTVIMAMIVAFAMIGTLGLAAATTYDSSVILENKDGSWQPITTDDITATIEYNSVGEEFAWHAFGVAKIPGVEYSLIYYADKPDRFNQWGGDNPGALIGTMTTVPVTGAFDEHGYTELNMDMPHPNDANMDEYDYCGAPDNYTTCHGAKLWMVPSADYTAPALTAWNPVNYLFETDLITYEDCDEFYPGAPLPATFSIGDSFNVDTVPIMILNATNAGSVDVTLTYNASLVTVTGVTNGDMDSMFCNIGVGQVRIGAYQTNNPGIDGDFAVANVAFEPVGNGSCNFGITVTTYKDATPCGRTMPYDIDEGVYCTYINGDVNGDGDVDMFDVMYLAKNVIGITGFEDIAECAAEVSGDGVLDIDDAKYLAKHILEITGYETLK